MSIKHLNRMNEAASLAYHRERNHRRAVAAWIDNGRQGDMPQQDRTDVTVQVGNVSCFISAPAQSSRADWGRENYKLDGKRVSRKVAEEALMLMEDEAPAVVVVEGETGSAASMIAQGSTLVAAGGKVQVGVLLDSATAADRYVTCDFSKVTMQELMHFTPNLMCYVDEGGQVEMGSSPHQAGMREGHEVEDLIYQVSRAWAHMNRYKNERAVMALTRKTAVVLLGRMRMALDLAWDNAQDKGGRKCAQVTRLVGEDIEKLKDSFAKSVDGAK